MGMYDQFSDANSMENMLSTSKARNMKHGWCQMVNGTVHYFQMPFNLAIIVEQLSNYDMLLREQIELENIGIVKQNSLTRDENRNGTKSNALATECIPKMHCNKSDGDYCKSECDWMYLKKSMPMTYFFKKCKNEDEKVKVNNEHSMLIDEYDNEEEDDDEMKCYKIKEDGLGSAVKTND